MASSGFKIKVGLDSTVAERGLANIGRSAQKINRRMGRLAGSGLKFAGGIAAATAALAGFAAVKFIKDSSAAAADFEKMATGFKSILGSADKASKRIKELQKFSVETPFEPAELIAASKQLQALGGDTMGIGDGLRAVGDAAAGATVPLEAVAMHAGRLFMGLKQGKAIGEYVNELQNMGVISEDNIGPIRKIQEEIASGKQGAMDNAQALAAVTAALGSTKGAMADLAATTAGKVSTMKGNLDMLKISFGEGINKGLSKGVDVMNERMPEWFDGAKKLGDSLGRGIGEAFTGNTQLLEMQITFAFQKLGEVGAAAFLRVITSIFSTAMPMLMDRFTETILDTLGPFAYLVPGLNTQLLATQAASAYLKSEGQSGDFDMADFMGGTSGLLGSEETAKNIEEHLARLVRLEEIREEKAFNRRMHDGIITAAYENISYVK